MRAALALLLVLTVLVPAAHAQVDPADETLFRFRVEIPGDAGFVPRSGSVHVPVTIYDESNDPPNPTGAPISLPSPHTVRFRVDALVEDPGWRATPPIGFTSYAGQVTERTLIIRAMPNAQNINFAVNITTEISTQSGYKVEFYHTVGARTEGPASFNAVGRSGGLTLGPREVGTAYVGIQNAGLYPQTFTLEIANNRCNLGVGLPDRITVGPKATVEETVSLEGPDDRLWYLFGEVCSVNLLVVPEGRENEARAVFLSVTVQGFNFEPPLFFWLLVAALALVLLALLIKRRKERIEEEILGKPQKPWTIPVEKLYLEKLKEKDERAWYVVRHHLMEEEYRSSLLWYHAYKRATRGARTKERVILREERAYQRWKQRWEKTIAAPPRKADRFEDRLQRRLDRKARRRHRKAVRRWRKDVKKIEAAQKKRHAKAHEKWQKAKARAEKKGRPVPPEPEPAAPDLPPQPQPQPIALEDHRLGRKAARYRRRMERKQGNLEVAYEKSDARHRRKVVKKMQRLARKLDDPEFVDEHPMLGS